MIMTSPERLRQRQYRLGIAVLILGLLTVVWGIVLESQSIKQRHCLQESLHDLNSAFTVRADLNDQRNEVLTEKAVLLDQQVTAQRTLIRSVAGADNQADVKAAFVTFARTDKELAVKSEQVTQHLADLNEKLKTTKVPAFPEGKCT